MTQVQCHACHARVASYDVIHFGSMETGYRDLCSRCFNEEVARTGQIELEQVGFQPIDMSDAAGVKRSLLDAGIVATVNSDDPAYFGGYVNENFTQIFAALGLSGQQAWQLAHNSFEASFIDAPLRRTYLDRLQETIEGFR